MIGKNPYIFNSASVTSDQAVIIRNNNTRFFIFASRFHSLNNNDKDAFQKLTMNIPKHVSKASSGTLFRNPKNMSALELNKKMQSLVKELAGNKPYPEYKDPNTNLPLTARQVFFTSFFWQNLSSIFRGDSYVKDPTIWANYKRYNTDLPSYIKPESNSIQAALTIYNIENLEIGLDMNRMLDTILVSDGNGNYRLRPDNSFETNNLLAEAVANQIRILKDNKIFKSIYYSPVFGSNKDDPENE